MPKQPKRQRDRLIQIRVSDSEYAEAAEAADRVGLTIASYARQRILGHTPPRAVRRPPLDRALVAQVLAALGPIATDVRAIARLLDQAQPGSGDRGKLDEALAALIDLREQVMKALKREP